MLPKQGMAKRTSRRRTMWVLMLSVVLAASAACTGASDGVKASAGSGGQLVWGKIAEADVLDPTIAGSGASWELLHLSYEHLVSIGDDLGVVPELAESWKQISPTAYEFAIRKGVKFSNGREMTVDDVVGSLRRLIDPAIAASWASQVGIRSVAARGDSHVQVVLARPKTSFLAALAGSAAAILPMKELAAGTFNPKKDILGTGPFKVVAHSQGESWTFERNQYYWREGLPKVDRLVARIMPEDAARAAALRDGSIDVTTFETPDTARLMEGVPNVKVVVQATTDYYRLDLNSRASIFRDDRLREAVALTIDRDRIRNVALGGVGRPTAAVLAAFDGVCDPSAIPFAKPNLERARELVEAAGATGKTVEIMVPSYVAMASPIAQVIQANIEVAGLKVRIVSVDLGVLVQRSVRSADFDMRLAWFAGYTDPAMNLFNWDPARAKGNSQWLKSDGLLTSLIDKSMESSPGVTRSKALRDACNRAAQTASLLPLVTKDAIVAYRSDRADARVQQLEGYALSLRHLAEFGRK